MAGDGSAYWCMNDYRCFHFRWAFTSDEHLPHVFRFQDATTTATATRTSQNKIFNSIVCRPICKTKTSNVQIHGIMSIMENVNTHRIFGLAVRVTRMAAEVTVIPDFWDDKFHSPRVPPGDDLPLSEETVDSGYEIDGKVNSIFNEFRARKEALWKHRWPKQNWSLCKYLKFTKLSKNIYSN